MSCETRSLRLSALSGISAVSIGYFTVFLSMALSPWFSWAENALSDLGVGGAGVIFNLGLAASGSLMMAFSLGLVELSEGCWAWRLGSYLLLLDAISLMGVGIFNEGFGRIHLYLSLAFFTLMPISLTTLGISLWRRGRKPLGLFTLSMGLATPAAWMMPWRGAAIPEAISASATAIWVVKMSLWMLRSGARDRLASCPLGRVSHP